MWANHPHEFSVIQNSNQWSDVEVTQERQSLRKRWNETTETGILNVTVFEIGV